MTDIPDWAGKRACELINDGLKTPTWTWPEDRGNHIASVVAKLVMQHEQPPVDPDVEAVKRIFARAVVSANPFQMLAAIEQYKQEKANG